GEGEHAVEIELRGEAGANVDAKLVAPPRSIPKREEPAAPLAPVAPPPAVDTAERERADRLARELEDAKKQSEKRSAAVSSELAEAKLEIMRLTQRLESLRSEVEAHKQEGDEAVQARLLQDRLADAERRNAALLDQVRSLEVAAKPAEAAPPV